MGMFDTIRCSYDLGPGFNNRSLQTKDIECMMLSLWVDPAGKLWEIDYSGTQDFMLNDTMDKPWNAFRSIPNGNHGKVRPYLLTRDVIVYPEKWSAQYAPFPECKVVFVRGIIESFEHIKKKNAESMETMGKVIRDEGREE